jgi:hypothetical protein
MSDHNSQLLRKAGFADLESALAAIDSMSDEIRNLHNQMEHLERQYGFAMAERDEARRIICHLDAKRMNSEDDSAPLTPQEVAKMIYAWDCFDFPLSSNP